MRALPAPVLPRVGQLVRMLASPHDGEALGACRAVGRVLSANGASFDDLAARIEHEPVPRVVYRDKPVDREPRSSEPSVKATLEAAIRAGGLSAWETQFMTSILAQITTSRTWRPSPKQEALITALLKKMDLMGACA